MIINRADRIKGADTMQWAAQYVETLNFSGESFGAAGWIACVEMMDTEREGFDDLSDVDQRTFLWLVGECLRLEDSDFTGPHAALGTQTPPSRDN